MYQYHAGVVEDRVYSGGDIDLTRVGNCAVAFPIPNRVSSLSCR
jgi:hypothetical protein